MSVLITQASDYLFHKMIVVVDDDEEIGTLITELMHEHSIHEVRHHVTGNQAIQAMHTSFAHLFILDYHLPDMIGPELHDRLHTFEHLKTVPTLLISSVKPPLRDLQQRAITYLAKPFDLMELLHTVTRLLE